MLSRLDSHELTEWAAYFGLEPWGTEVEDWRAGMVAATYANVHRDSRQQPDPYQPADFMPRRGPVESQDGATHETVMDMWSLAWRGRFEQGGDL